MKPSTQLFVALVALAALMGMEGKKLPSYLKACRQSEPEFQECALASARAALPFILQGDRKLRTPVLNPVQVTSLRMDTGGLKLTLVDVNFVGLQEMTLERLNVDVSGGKIEYVGFTPLWSALGRYEITGRVALLPVSGSGDLNVTMENGFWTQTIRFELPEGAEHYRVTDSVVEVNTTRGHFQLDNLFSGDKLLGGQLNRFMNENWQEIVELMEPSFRQAYSDIYRQVFEGIFAKVPAAEIFPA